jgi:tetrahydromethanopterin S-methyltransferase subunit A
VSNAVAEVTGLPSRPSVCAAASAPAGARTIGFARKAPVWPVEPGEYLIGRPASPVAVCTLGSDSLPNALADRIGRIAFAVAGRTHTENIGIEKIVRNIVTNASIRFLLLCGSEPKGHLPGRSLLALARNGVDAAQRIIGSPGQRPYLRNLGPAEVARFRVQVEIIDHIGSENVERLAADLRELGQRDPGAFAGTIVAGQVPVIEARDSGRLVLDPAGFFIIYPRQEERTILLEHYRTDGTLNEVITGTDPALIALAAVERKLVSRLDHAAYLGRELEKAFRSMSQGFPYVQDSAPGK